MSFDRYDLLERNLDRQIAWVRTSDSKISMVLPINSAMLAVLASQLGQVHDATGLHHWLLAGAASIPCFISFASAVRSAMPKLRHHGNSLIYYDDVAHHAADSYRDRLRVLTEDEHFEDLAAQVHMSAALARDRMRHVRHAYVALFVALPFWIAALYLLNTAR